MNKIYNPNRSEWDSITERPLISLSELEPIVKGVFDKIKTKGDAALRHYTLQFDKVQIENFQVTEQEVEEANQLISKELKDAIAVAYQNVKKFHESQQLQSQKIETTEGVTCWQESRPIQKVGIYIPGGSAPLFSTVLMLGVPATIAGCEQIVLCTPPNAEGKIHPAILYTAQLIGIKLIYKVGGIQAIGAMTFGTTTIPNVYKIFGPGNQYVTAAKQVAVEYGLAIDMPAGPSELLVVADETCVPAFVAADLLSQAEHGADSQVICVVNNEKTLLEIEAEVAQQLAVLPRKAIAEKAIEKSRLVLIENQKDSLDFINEYAPEHFIIATQNEDFYIQNIVNAGSVFIGNYTPESAGDYASGTNHTLPTNGYARTYSGVNLDTFTKKITFQKITAAGMRNLGNTIELMAEAELLHAHKNAVTLRLEQLK